MNNLALWYFETGNYDSARQLLLESLESQSGPMAEKHPNVASSMALLAYVYVEFGRYEEARRLAVQATNIFAVTLPENHWRSGIATGAEGAALVGIGRYDEAEVLLLRSHEMLTTQNASLPIFARQVVRNLAMLYERWGKPDEATRYSRMLPD